MKRSLLTGFRAFLFAVSAFALLALSGGIKVHRAMDVSLFVIGLMVFWVLIEKVFLNFRAKRQTRPGSL